TGVVQALVDGNAGRFDDQKARRLRAGVLDASREGDELTSGPTMELQIDQFPPPRDLSFDLLDRIKKLLVPDGAVPREEVALVLPALAVVVDVQEQIDLAAGARLGIDLLHQSRKQAGDPRIEGQLRDFDVEFGRTQAVLRANANVFCRDSRRTALRRQFGG